MATSSTTADKPTRQRGADGRFMPGNPGGPGRPARPAASKSYIEMCRLEASPEAMQLVVRRLVRQAQNGSVRAAELLLRWFVPMVQPIDESRLSTTAPDDAEFRIAGGNRIEIMLQNLRLYVERCREVDQQLRASGNPSPYETNSPQSLPNPAEPVR